MKLYQEILGNLNVEIPTAELLELKCYGAIEQIKKVIEDERLSDANCFAGFLTVKIAQARLEALRRLYFFVKFKF